MKKKLEFTFSLIENAQDSLDHAIKHFTRIKNPKARDIKISIRDTIHAIELLLKERLRRCHEAFIYPRIDDFPGKRNRTIGLDLTLSRLQKLGGLKLDSTQLKTISRAKSIRNDIEHFECKFNKFEARTLIARLLSFIFQFSEEHLSIDLRKQYINKSGWSDLVKYTDFLYEQGLLMSQKNYINWDPEEYAECPSCELICFNIPRMKCDLCEYEDDLHPCGICGYYYEEDKLLCPYQDCDYYSPSNKERDSYCSDCYKSLADEEHARSYGY